MVNKFSDIPGCSPSLAIFWRLSWVDSYRETSPIDKLWEHVVGIILPQIAVPEVAGIKINSCAWGNGNKEQFDIRIMSHIISIVSVDKIKRG